MHTADTTKRTYLITSCRILPRTFSSICSSLFLVQLAFSCTPSSNGSSAAEISEDERKIRQVHADYVEGWKSMDEQKLMSLLIEDSQIQPNRLTPIVGKENIREFWFPKDSSRTTINEFDTEIISLNILDTIAVTTHRSILDWDYQKDSTYFGMYQEGINTTIYQKQTSDSWKIWRSMWTDLLVKNK